MVTPDGRVKLLDFGLAKLIETVETDEFATTATIKPQTEDGRIVGTIAYMSPEQAEGKKIGARSDIFSFGSLLYEMVSGRRAFEGQSKISTLSAILHKEPPSIEGSPPELQKIITRCLQKEPERRSQHMEDVGVALAEVREKLASDPSVMAATRRPRVRAPVALSITGIIFVVATIGAAWLWWRTPSTLPAPTLTRLTSDSGLTTDPALSPDGKLLAYASDRSGDGNLDIYLRQVGGGEPIRLTQDPADDREPAFSPDGTKIAFARSVGGVFIVSALGGSAQLVGPRGQRPQFSPDGKWIAYWVGNLVGGAYLSVRSECKIYVAPSVGGTPRQVQPDFAAAVYPIWSPDGKYLLFLGNRDEKLPPEEGIDWWVTTLDSGLATKTGALEATRSEKLSGPLLHNQALVASAWQPNSDSVVFSARSGDSTNLWRIGISPNTLKTTGPPQRLTSGPSFEENPSVVIAPGGGLRVEFANLSENIDLWSLPVAANQGKVTGELQRLTQDAAADFNPALSRDGSKIVFVSARSGNHEIWIKDLRTGEESAITSSRSNKAMPRFSPDGSKVSFSNNDNQKGNIYVVPAVGGASEKICENCGVATDWSSDGKRLLVMSSGRIGQIEAATGRYMEWFARPDRWLGANRFSPDERWLVVYQEHPHQLYVAPFPGESAVEDKFIPVDVGEGWSPDGTLLYGYKGHEGFLCIYAQRLDRTSKRPVGDRFAILHAHNARRRLGRQGDFEMAVGRDRLVFGMGERVGNIWTAEWRSQR
jgi:eukaryotic-like serine/threonine-protein kinase